MSDSYYGFQEIVTIFLHMISEAINLDAIGNIVFVDEERHF